MLRTARRRHRDLVPLRRRAARVPEHRRARARRRLVGGGPLRRRGHPRRPGHLLLSRRARVAVLLPVDDRRTTPSSSAAGTSPPRAARSCGCGTRRPGRSRSSTTATSPGGPPSMTATPRSTRRRAPPLGAAGPGARAASRSSTRSRAAATMCASPSTSARTSQVELDGSCAVAALARGVRPERRGWSCRPGSSGACTGARPSPSSAGTLRAWAPRPRVHAARPRALRGRRCRWPPGWSSSKLGRRSRSGRFPAGRIMVHIRRRPG